MIIHLFRKSGRYGCNAMFKSSVHPRKNYIEKLRSSRKKRLLFTAKSVKSRLQYSQYVNTCKRCIRIEIHTLNQNLQTNVNKRFHFIFTGRLIYYRNPCPRDMKDSHLILWCWILFRHTKSKNHSKIQEPKPNLHSEFV